MINIKVGHFHKYISQATLWAGKVCPNFPYLPTWLKGEKYGKNK